VKNAAFQEFTYYIFHLRSFTVLGFLNLNSGATSTQTELV
jgi:hypothetical protein